MTRLDTWAVMPDRVDKRRVARWAGVACLALGLILLGTVAWQYYGTTWVSKRHQHQTVTELKHAWGQHKKTVATKWGKAEAIVEIPRFGRKYAVPVFEGTSDSVLSSGFGHFTGTAGPGEVGNYALAAHRITHGEPLRHMPDLEPGDKIKIRTRTATYVYELTTSGGGLVVNHTATWVTQALPHNPGGGVEPTQQDGQRLITLTTCSELFHTDDRMVAFGVLVATEPAAGA